MLRLTKCQEIRIIIFIKEYNFIGNGQFGGWRLFTNIKYSKWEYHYWYHSNETVLYTSGIILQYDDQNLLCWDELTGMKWKQCSPNTIRFNNTSLVIYKVVWKMYGIGIWQFGNLSTTKKHATNFAKIKTIFAA